MISCRNLGLPVAVFLMQLDISQAGSVTGIIVRRPKEIKLRNIQRKSESEQCDNKPAPEIVIGILSTARM